MVKRVCIVAFSGFWGISFVFLGTENMGFVKVFVDKKYSFAIRALFFLAAFYFIQEVYYCFSTGIVVSHGRVVELSKNSSNFYAAVFKKCAFVFAFSYFAFFGIKSRAENGDDNAKDGEQQKNKK